MQSSKFTHERDGSEQGESLRGVIFAAAPWLFAAAVAMVALL